MYDIKSLDLYDYVRESIGKYIKEGDGDKSPDEILERIKRRSYNFEGYELFLPELNKIEDAGRFLAKYDTDFFNIYNNFYAGKIDDIFHIIIIVIDVIIDDLELYDLEY